MCNEKEKQKPLALTRDIAELWFLPCSHAVKIRQSSTDQASGHFEGLFRKGLPIPSGNSRLDVTFQCSTVLHLNPLGDVSWEPQSNHDYFLVTKKCDNAHVTWESEWCKQWNLDSKYQFGIVCTCGELQCSVTIRTLQWSPHVTCFTRKQCVPPCPTPCVMIIIIGLTSYTVILPRIYKIKRVPMIV